MTDKQGMKFALLATAMFAEQGLRWERDEATGTWTVHGVPLFGVGTWNKQKYGEDFCEKLVAATNSALDVLKPRLGPGHSPVGLTEKELVEWRTKQPRLGLIGKLKMVAERVYAEAISKIPDWLKKQIDAGTWGPMSVELTRREDFGWVLDHVGLLGAKAPAVPWAGVDAFAESETRMVFVLEEEPGDDAGEKSPTQTFEATGDATPPKKAQGGEMDERELKAAQEEAARKTEEAEAAIAKAKTASEAADEREKRLHAAKIDGMAERLLEAQKASPGELETFKLVAAGTDDAKVLTFGEKESGTALDGLFKSWMGRAVIGKPTTGSEAGAEEDVRPMTERIEEAATKIVEAEKLSFADALGKVERLHPEWVEDWRKDTFKTLSGKGV